MTDLQFASPKFTCGRPPFTRERIFGRGLAGAVFSQGAYESAQRISWHIDLRCTNATGGHTHSAPKLVVPVLIHAYVYCVSSRNLPLDCLHYTQELALQSTACALVQLPDLLFNVFGPGMSLLNAVEPHLLSIVSDKRVALLEPCDLRAHTGRLVSFELPGPQILGLIVNGAVSGMVGLMSLTNSSSTSSRDRPASSGTKKVTKMKLQKEMPPNIHPTLDVLVRPVNGAAAITYGKLYVITNAATTSVKVAKPMTGVSTSPKAACSSHFFVAF